MDDPVRNPYVKESDVGNANNLGRETSLKQHVRTGQIITFSMIFGVIMVFVIFTVIIDVGNDQQEEANSLFLWVGVAAGVLACVASCVITTVLRGQALTRFREQSREHNAVKSDDQILTPASTQLLMTMFNVTLIGQAILEGTAIINLVLMLIDHNPLHLAVVAVMIVGMAMLTPTMSRRRALLEEGLLV